MDHRAGAVQDISAQPGMGRIIQRRHAELSFDQFGIDSEKGP